MQCAGPALGAALALLVACTRGEPPRWSAEGSVDSVEPMPPRSTPDADASDSAQKAAVDPGTLPQTRDFPESGGAVLGRMAALWDGIVRDDAALAMPCFFPLAAYEQTKAIAHPAADWKYRLVAAYARDVHALHTRLGEGAAHAKFVDLEVPGGRARWIEPGDEGNKTGYYRVYGARIRYESGGRAGAFDVASMISWRGEWYVVHLAGFK